MKFIHFKQTWHVLGAGREECRSLLALALRLGFRVGDLCRELGCSERYLRTVFVRDVGLPPKNWMRQERMVMARHMLQQGLAPEEVTEKLQFSTPNNFRREFQKFYRMSPMAYQNKWRHMDFRGPGSALVAPGARQIKR
jgi:AraC-like DNA-binding protein